MIKEIYSYTPNTLYYTHVKIYVSGCNIGKLYEEIGRCLSLIESEFNQEDALLYWRARPFVYEKGNKYLGGFRLSIHPELSDKTVSDLSININGITKNADIYRIENTKMNNLHNRYYEGYVF